MSELETIDPRLLERAGWSPEELYWEELSEAALDLPPAEAAQHWREAAAAAPACFSAGDARLATSLANLAMAESLVGDPVLAPHLLERAVAAWQESSDWVSQLKPERRARSSLFHQRLQSKHPGAYDHWSLERYQALYRQGAAALAARRDAAYRPEIPPLQAWRQQRPAGLEDSRRLIAAVTLIAADP